MDAPQTLNSILRSIQVGMPQQIEEEDDKGAHIWRTGYIKTAVAGPIWLAFDNLVGDGQADKHYHGGPDQALLAYSADHYTTWNAELAINLPYGAFGENYTISGQNEQTVCIGDIYAIGDARIQITQPRGPCSNIGHRWGIPTLTKLVEKSGRTGWYLRVLQEGYVEAGQQVTLLEHPYPRWTITAATQAIRKRHKNPSPALELLAIPALGIRTRSQLEELKVATAL